MDRQSSLVFSLGCLAVLVLHGACAAQSIAGVQVGDSFASLAKLSKPDISQPMGAYFVQKWTDANSNALSITVDTRTNEVVFVERDWGHKETGAASDIPGLKFGVTTLADLRKKLGSNGFFFEGAPGVLKVDDGLVLMNSYEIGRPGGVVATWVTKIPLERIAANNFKMASDDVASWAALDAMMIGDPAYLATLWKQRSAPDPAYKPPPWPGDKP